MNFMHMESVSVSGSEKRSERSRSDAENNNILMQQEYLRNIPETLGEREYERELAENSVREKIRGEIFL